MNYAYARRALAVVLLTAALGCMSSAKNLGKVNPAEKSGLNRVVIANQMNGLAYNIDALRLLLRRYDSMADYQKAEVAHRLDEMEKLARVISELHGAASPTAFDHRLNRFIGDVAFAKEAAERVFPDFAPAERISGSCGVCHQASSDDLEKEHGGKPGRI